MMNNSSVPMILAFLISVGPLLLVFVGGGVAALVNWRRCPTASLLVLLAMADLALFRVLNGLVSTLGIPLMREQCPVDGATLKALGFRLEGMRGAFLHLFEKPVAEDWGFKVAWNAVPPTVTVTAQVGRKKARAETVIIGEVVDLLDAVDPWLSAHLDRFTQASISSRCNVPRGPVKAPTARPASLLNRPTT